MSVFQQLLLDAANAAAAAADPITRPELPSIQDPGWLGWVTDYSRIEQIQADWDRLCMHS